MRDEDIVLSIMATLAISYLAYLAFYIFKKVVPYMIQLAGTNSMKVLLVFLFTEFKERRSKDILAEKYFDKVVQFMALLAFLTLGLYRYFVR